MSRRPWGKQGSEEELTNAFQAFDNSGTGYISAAVMRHYLTQMGEALTDEELDQMFKHIPQDGDGNIPFDGKEPNFTFVLVGRWLIN